MAEKRIVSDLVLEQYHLGELSAEEGALVRGELSRSAELRARLADLEESDRRILETYPAETMVARIRERADAQRDVEREKERFRAGRRFSRPLAWGLSVAAMVLAVFSIVISVEHSRSDTTRLKGLTPHLSVFRKTLAGAEELRAGAEASRGDVLQLSYTAADARYGVILSIDGRGSVTWHLPPVGRGTAPSLDQQGTEVLPSAYELDDAPSFERFFLVYGTTPFAVDDVARAAADLAGKPSSAARDPLTLPRGLGQYSLLVKKKG
ncbi:MAG TPA: ActD-like protein [Spirochaetia bacterium]